jgi:hypothetical protein
VGNSAAALRQDAFRLRASTHLLFICVALGCSPAGASNATGDSWGVRLSGQTLESLSEINTGKPSGQPLDVKPLFQRQRGDVSIELRADASTAGWLQEADKTLAPEIDKGLDWLQRLRPRQHPRVTLILTLVAPQHHVALRRLHDSRERMVVDLAVAVAPTTSRSAAVAKALGVGLHEMSHAFSNASFSGRDMRRRDDEYRSSMVESCYLVDTMRVGDTLRLAPRQGADGDEYFVTAQSRDASRDVVTALARAAGTDTVRWNDNVALLGLKLACGIALAQR